MQLDASSQRVLLAWDGSPAAATALPFIQAVAEQLGARVEAIYVAGDDGDSEERRRAVSEAERSGLALRVLTGDPAVEIIRSAEEGGVLLLALTTHGRQIERRDARLGRMAEKVLAQTTRPVLIVKPESSLEKVPGALKRLLVPIDGTPKTATALHPIMELAGLLGASVDLLYVAESDHKVSAEPGSMTAPRYIDQPQHGWPEWGGEVIERLATVCAGCPREVPVHVFLAQGNPGQEITRFANENSLDAIVLVRRSRFQAGRAKVIRSVLSLSPCFVMIVGGEET